MKKAWCLLLALPVAALAYILLAQEDEIVGTWVSRNNALYECDGKTMVCVRIPDPKFQLWLNEVRLKDIQRSDNGYTAKQALRDRSDGHIIMWNDAHIEVSRDVLTLTIDLPDASEVEGELRELIERTPTDKIVDKFRRLK